jgi:glycerophosphoryl diester phosphodiesterase
MPRKNITLTTMIMLTALFALAAAVSAGDRENGHQKKSLGVQLGPRPFYLVRNMDASRLKTELEQCSDGPFKKPTLPSATAARPCSFPSTPGSHTSQPHVWEPASSSAM